MNLQENLSLGFSTLLVGLSTVFLVLIFIMLFIKVQTIFISYYETQKKNNKE